MRVKELDDRYLLDVTAGNKEIKYYFDQLEISTTVIKILLGGMEKARIVNSEGKYFFVVTDGSSFVKVRVSESDRDDLVRKMDDNYINDLR